MLLNLIVFTLRYDIFPMELFSYNYEIFVWITSPASTERHSSVLFGGLLISSEKEFHSESGVT